MNTIVLKPERDRSIRLRHPWIFASAIGETIGNPQPGETVLVKSVKNESLAVASYSPGSQIRCRVWSFDPNEVINKDFFASRIKRAILLRRQFISEGETNAYRLIHGESDELPGLIVDQYGDVLVIQVLTAGMEVHKEIILDCLVELIHPASIYERSDVDVRQLEGLEDHKGLLYGKEVPSSIEIQENGLKFYVDIVNGQKTGFFIDQRKNRQALLPLVKGKSVLNCFCYTGAFSVYALAGGAESVLSIDSSESALGEVSRNVELNHLPMSRSEIMAADIFKVLRKFRDQARSFDVIILDPPKFAPTIAQAEKAARGYKDINLLAFKLLNPGGILFTFSCSGGISRDLFHKIVSGAALDAGVNARIVGQLSQAPDHPISVYFPEGFYLKGLICQI